MNDRQRSLKWEAVSEATSVELISVELISDYVHAKSLAISDRAIATSDAVSTILEKGTTE
jgi:hypothetical protein